RRAAVAVAPVTVDQVAVVAYLAGAQDTVAAGRRAAMGIAPVAIDEIAIVAHLEWSEDTIAAARGVDVDVEASPLAEASLVVRIGDQHAAGHDGQRRPEALVLELVPADRRRVRDGLEQCSGRSLEHVGRTDARIGIVVPVHTADTEAGVSHDDTAVSHRHRPAELGVLDRVVRIGEGAQQSPGRDVEQPHRALPGRRRRSADQQVSAERGERDAEGGRYALGAWIEDRAAQRARVGVEHVYGAIHRRRDDYRIAEAEDRGPELDPELLRPRSWIEIRLLERAGDAVEAVRCPLEGGADEHVA